MPTANSSTARTGHAGKAVIGTSLVYRITQWSFNPTCSESAWGDSDSEGYTNRAAARKDGTGSVTAKFDTDRKPYTLLMPGDILKLTLWESAADYWALPRTLVTAFSLTYDNDSKEVVEWNSDFGCDGKYYYPGQSGAPVETLPSS